MIIAIDGPAGSGKSTTARAVARRLGFVYVDTGAMYRAVALALSWKGGLHAVDDMPGFLDSLSLDLKPAEDGVRVFLNGDDVSEAIREPEVSEQVSEVAARSDVRRFLVKEQRQLAAHARGGVVMEGRDIGTVVFPAADLKVFLTASVSERARRRHAELESRGHGSDIARVQGELERRDRLDSTREDSPLTRAPDAVDLDTSSLTIREQVSAIVEMARERVTSG